MAMFCLAMNMTPDEYMRLTLRQRNAFLDAYMERASG